MINRKNFYKVYTEKNKLEIFPLVTGVVLSQIGEIKTPNIGVIYSH